MTMATSPLSGVQVLRIISWSNIRMVEMMAVANSAETVDLPPRTTAQLFVDGLVSQKVLAKLRTAGFWWAGARSREKRPAGAPPLLMKLHSFAECYISVAKLRTKPSQGGLGMHS